MAHHVLQHPWLGPIGKDLLGEVVAQEMDVQTDVQTGDASGLQRIAAKPSSASEEVRRLSGEPLRMFVPCYRLLSTKAGHADLEAGSLQPTAYFTSTVNGAVMTCPSHCTCTQIL